MSKIEKWFNRAAARASRAAGHPYTFLVAVALVAAWLAVGPFAHWSDTWQLLANTSTTIVTFLLGFLIIAGQERSAAAEQAKLDGVIEALPEASNDLVGIEKEDGVGSPAGQKCTPEPPEAESE